MSVPPESNAASANEAQEILLNQLESQSVEQDGKEAIKEEVSVLDVGSEMRKQQLKRLIEENQARKTFINWIFAVTVLWMFCVLMIVVQCGRQSIILSDGVLIALITTTTANVFGFFYVVVNYLFNRNKST